MRGELPLEEVLKKQNQKLKVINILAAEVNRSLDLGKILGYSLDKAGEIIGADFASLLLVSQDQTLIPKVLKGIPGEVAREIQELQLKVGEGLDGQVVLSKQPLLVEDLTNGLEGGRLIKIKKILERLQASSYLGVPILSRDEALGVIGMGSREKGYFTGHDLEFLITLANHLGIAIKKTHQYQLERELSLLAKSQQLIASSLNLKEVLAFIVDACADLMKVSACHIRLFNEDQELVVVAASGAYKEALGEFRNLKIGESFSGWVVAHGEPLIVPDVTSDERNVHAPLSRKYGFKSFLGIPLKIREKVIGVLGMNTDRTRYFSEEEIRLISSFAGQAALAIENARLYTLAQQELAERKRVEEEVRNFHNLLDSIRLAQSQFIADADPRMIFDGLLNVLLSLTQSEYGFIGEILYTPEGDPYLKTHAITNVAWDDPPREFDEKNAPTGLEFYNLKTLLGAVLTTGGPVISNDPSADPWQGRLPKGHPPLNAFLGIPFYPGEKLIGMVGIANRPGGYNEELIQYLQPFLTTCANLMEAYRNDQRRKQAEEALRRGKERFQSIYEAVASGIVVRNAEGSVVHANETGCKLMGLTLDQLQGRAPLDPGWHTIHEDGSPFPLETYPIMVTARTGKPVHNVVMGICSAESKEPRWILVNSEPIFDPDTGLLKEAVATFVDITERKQAEEKIRRLNRLYSVLSQINETIVRVRDVEELYRRTCRIAVEQGWIRMAWVGLVDSQTLLVKPVAHWGFEERGLDNVWIYPGEGELIAAAIREGRYLIRNSIEPDAGQGPSSEEALRRGYRSCAVFPLRVGGQVIGTLNFYAEEPYFFNEEEIRLLEALSGDISFAIESIEQEKQRKRAEERLRQQNEYLAALHETTLGLMNRLELSNLLEALVTRAGALVGTQHGYVRLVEPGGTEMVMKVGIGIFSKLIGHRLKMGEGLGGKVWQTGQLIAVEDYRTWPGRLPDSRYQILHAEVALPLKSGHQVTGVLCLGFLEEGRTFGDEEIALLIRFAQLASIALDNAQLYTSAQQELAERIRTEETLRQNEERYRMVVEQVAEGIFLVDVETKRIVESNRAFQNLLGYSREEILGLTIYDFVFVAHDRESIDRNLQNVLTKKYHFASERQYRRKDGSLVDVEISANLIFYGGREVICGVIRDITERKRIEAERLKVSKLESIGVLAGGIAHDFNNILTAVLMNISLAKMYAPPQDKISKRLTEAEKACLRARDLTQQLLTFSKGGAPIKKTASIAELIRESANFAVRGSKVRCQVSLPGDLWPVEVDEGQMSQVIHNLVINAQQAMPEGGTIQIRAENREVGTEGEQGLPLGAGRYVKLSIADEGSGIAEEHLPKIFDPYFTTKEGGSGLGLATTYSILKRHGGYIGVASRVGVGTTFYVYIPASGEGEWVKPVEGRGGVLRGVSKGRVLLMDDEEMLREAAGQMLQHMGYEVEFAEDGGEALELYKRARESGQPFHVVIMDLTIPGRMGGKETVQRLLEIDPQAKAIVSSGYSEDPIMAEYRRYGFKGVITKPYKLEELNQTLQQIIAD